MTAMSLRPAVADDCAMVFSWRNDPFIVGQSTSRKQVEWADHKKWFASALASPDQLVWIIMVDQKSAGLARFERDDRQAATISVYLMQPFTGQGFGVDAIAAASAACFERWALPVHAFVRAANSAGRKAFGKAGYVADSNLAAPADHVAMVFRPTVANAAWVADDAFNRAYYDERVERFGIDAQSADWSSGKTQTLRFEVLTSVDQIDGRRVLDVGCGIGELLAWLRQSGMSVDYTGADISPKMVETARERFPGVPFLNCSVVDLPKCVGGTFDHVFASGLFTYRREHSKEFVVRAVEVMFSLCTRSASFNVLSTWGSKAEPGEFRLDPCEAMTICRKFTSRLALRHDYHRGDFTVHLYREPLTP